MAPMHEHSFPESSESSERRSARAVAALEYEERAQLGFRRRRMAAGDPWAAPDGFQVDREVSSGELIAGWFAGFGVAFGATALFLRPLLFGFLAVVCALVGLMGGGQAARTARVAMIIASICFFLGMMFSIMMERPIF